MTKEDDNYNYRLPTRKELEEDKDKLDLVFDGYIVDTMSQDDLIYESGFSFYWTDQFEGFSRKNILEEQSNDYDEYWIKEEDLGHLILIKEKITILPKINIYADIYIKERSHRFSIDINKIISLSTPKTLIVGDAKLNRDFIVMSLFEEKETYNNKYNEFSFNIYLSNDIDLKISFLYSQNDLLYGNNIEEEIETLKKKIKSLHSEVEKVVL